MSLTPEQIVQERVNFAGFIAGRTTSTILPYVAIWLACAESKQEEIDAVRLANIDAKQWIGSGKLEIDALKALVAELEKDAAIMASCINEFQQKVLRSDAACVHCYPNGKYIADGYKCPIAVSEEYLVMEKP